MNIEKERNRKQHAAAKTGDDKIVQKDSARSEDKEAMDALKQRIDDKGCI